MTATRTAVTNKIRTKLLNLTDARVVVEWLNAAKDAKATGYKRVVSIRHQLDALRALCIKLTEYGSGELDEQRALVLAKDGRKSREVHFPADEKTSRQAKRLHSLVNGKLSRYTHRPCVTYFVAGGVWRGVMVPVDNARGFVLKIEHEVVRGRKPTITTISEADVVLRLVRLDLMGELSKVHLCENCQARWLERAKNNWRFCPRTECREQFYAKDPGYHQRKAANQRAYRQREKLLDANAKVTLAERVIKL